MTRPCKKSAILYHGSIFMIRGMIGILTNIQRRLDTHDYSTRDPDWKYLESKPMKSACNEAIQELKELGDYIADILEYKRPFNVSSPGL